MKISLCILALILVTSACNIQTEKRTEYLNYRPRLDSISLINSTPNDTLRKVNLCSLFDKAEWDSIVIIRPYLPKKYLDAIDFGTKIKAKDSMDYVIGVEWAQGLLFFNKNELSNYSVIGGNPSFSQIDALFPTAVPVLTRSNCEVLLANVRSLDGDQSFFFLPTGFEHKFLTPEQIKPPIGSLDSLLGK